MLAWYGTPDVTISSNQPMRPQGGAGMVPHHAPKFHGGVTAYSTQWNTNDHSLQYTKPLNASWCIKHPERDNNECPGKCNQNSFDCPLNCMWARHTYGPSWYGEKDKIPLAGRSPLWNCQVEIGCKDIDEMPLLWLYPPVREALTQGCLCSNTSYLRPSVLDCSKKSYCRPLTTIPGSCQTATVPAPPNLLWVCSDGHLYSRLYPTVLGLACMLAALSLCPIYREGPVPYKWWDHRPRSVQKGWQEASTRVGWLMESIFGLGVAPVRNRQSILELSLQLSALANVTSDSLGLLNNQLQHTSKMTIQNQAVLDLMLLKEKGVCGVLNLSMDNCCVHIPNESMPLQDQINKIKKVARDSEAIASALGTNWLGKVFDMFRFSLMGWMTSLLQSLIMIVVVIIVICIAISCIKRLVVKSVLTVKYTPLKPVRALNLPASDIPH
ncbi:uncharacterized protein ACIBXB_005861 [Morphnus guianensis]